MHEKVYGNTSIFHKIRLLKKNIRLIWPMVDKAIIFFLSISNKVRKPL